MSPEKQERNFMNLLATVAGVLGFFTTLVSFIISIQEWTHNPLTFRAVSIAGFLFCLLGVLWFAFGAKKVNPVWRWIALGMLYLGTALYFLWVGTWIVTPTSPIPNRTSDHVIYQVRVRAEMTGTDLEGAKVTIDVSGRAPLDDITDSNGFARIKIPSSYMGEPARLAVEATGYQNYEQHIDLEEDVLPDIILLRSDTAQSRSGVRFG